MDLINKLYLLTDDMPSFLDNPEAMDLIEQLNKVKKQELERLMKMSLRKRMKEVNSLVVLNPLLKDVTYNDIEQVKTSKKQVKKWFITISFDDSKFDPLNVEKIMTDLLNKQYLKADHYWWCIEQRSEDYNYYGFHVHLYIDNKKHQKSRLIDCVYCSVKNFVGGKNEIDVRPVYTDNGVINYMSGEKPEEKLKKVEYDISMRKKYKLKDVYTNECK